MTQKLIVRLPEELHEILRTKAFNERTSINKIVVGILEKELREGC